MRLKSDFFILSAPEAAPLLLGKLLCRTFCGCSGDKKTIKYRIIETEAYYGEDDSACHASKGKTPRNSIMYEQGGAAYIYLCYGIHNLLNVVTGKKDFPEAVLIRGVQGFNGPGKLTKSMNITRELNGENLIDSKQIWLEDDGVKFEYEVSKRIGIDYALEKDRNKLWRFTVK